MDQGLSSRACEGGPDLCSFVKVVERGFDDFVDMRFRGRGLDQGSLRGCVSGMKVRYWGHQW